ncbi:hypothetical protein [Arthrobacter sp. B3I4]|nr:hypothetical protein [Arthrobacter sp. B3I4]MDQ0756233.1 hypothetical protein [Arthrobacter sp. B3I4]
MTRSAHVVGTGVAATGFANFTDSLWGFELKDAPGGGTRLVVSGYWA